MDANVIGHEIYQTILPSDERYGRCAGAGGFTKRGDYWTTVYKDGTVDVADDWTGATHDNFVQRIDNAITVYVAPS